jgi:hypothetical protein
MRHGDATLRFSHTAALRVGHSLPVLPYEVIRFIKFAGVLAFVGGAVASMVARDLASRRIAIHRVASPGLLATWVGGYLLTDALARKTSEPWIGGAFILTFLLQGMLTWSVAREDRRRPAVMLASLALLVATLAIMVWRPGAR